MKPKMCLIYCCILLLGSSPSFAMEYSIRADQGINLVYMRGYIEFSEARKFNGVLGSLDATLNTLVVIDSPGGAGYMGLFLSQRLADFSQQQRSLHKRVAVLVSEQCASICIPLFYAFDERYATAGARFGFHSGSAGSFANDDQLTGTMLANIVERAQSRGDTRTAAWIAEQKRLGTFLSRVMVYFSGDQMANGESGFLTPQSLVESERELLSKLK